MSVKQLGYVLFALKTRDEGSWDEVNSFLTVICDKLRSAGFKVMSTETSPNAETQLSMGLQNLAMYVEESCASKRLKRGPKSVGNARYGWVVAIPFKIL